MDKLEVQVSKNSDSERQVWMGGYETVWSMQGDHNDTWLHGTVKLGRSLLRNLWLKRKKKKEKKTSCFLCCQICTSGTLEMNPSTTMNPQEPDSTLEYIWWATLEAAMTVTLQLMTSSSSTVLDVSCSQYISFTNRNRLHLTF